MSEADKGQGPWRVLDATKLLAVEVFPGNMTDLAAVKEEVETIKRRVGIIEVGLVGARDMVKAAGKAAVAEAGFRYLTVLMEPQVRKLLRRQTQVKGEGLSEPPLE